jgi:hypothetical protein
MEALAQKVEKYSFLEKYTIFFVVNKHTMKKKKKQNNLKLTKKQEKKE